MQVELKYGEDKAFHINWSHIFANPERRSKWMTAMTDRIKEINPDLVVGVASRGHLFGFPAAILLNLPYAAIYKDRPYDKPETPSIPATILVVDDIICHGKTMNNVIPRLEKIYPTAVVKPLTAIHIRHGDNKYSPKCGLLSVKANIEDAIISEGSITIEDGGVISLEDTYITSISSSKIEDCEILSIEDCGVISLEDAVMSKKTTTIEDCATLTIEDSALL